MTLLFALRSLPPHGNCDSGILLDRLDIIEIDMGVHRRIADRIAVDGEMLHGGLVEHTAVLALELAERQCHELRLRFLRELCEIDLEVLAVAVRLDDELLALAVRRDPELNGIVVRPVDTL